MAKALIIDDVKFIYSNLKNILNDNGIDTFEYVDSSNKAITIFNNNENDIDIIFLSLNIPNSDQFEDSIAVIKKLKSLDPFLRIVIIKPLDNQQTTLKALQAGASDFIEKPLKKDQIIEVLKKQTLL